MCLYLKTVSFVAIIMATFWELKCPPNNHIPGGLLTDIAFNTTQKNQKDKNSYIYIYYILFILTFYYAFWTKLR